MSGQNQQKSFACLELLRWFDSSYLQPFRKPEPGFSLNCLSMISTLFNSLIGYPVKVSLSPVQLPPVVVGMASFQDLSTCARLLSPNSTNRLLNTGSLVLFVKVPSIFKKSCLDSRMMMSNSDYRLLTLILLSAVVFGDRG